MAPKAQTVGGGPATGLAKDFTNALDKWLNTGSFGTAGGTAAGAGAYNQSVGGMGVLNDILSSGAGNLGGSLNQLIQQHQAQDIGDLRSRFGASGGMAFGSPAAYAEGNYRAHAAPEAATAIGNLQLSALGPLLNIIAGLSGKGIPQAETVMTPNPFLSGFEALSGALPGIADVRKAFGGSGGNG